MKKRIFIVLMLALSLTLSACGGSSGGNVPAATDEAELGEAIEPITVLASLPEDNMVNYEMANEIAEELKKIGVDMKVEATDFAVLMDRLYGEESNYDAYTIGWSGRVESGKATLF